MKGNFVKSLDSARVEYYRILILYIITITKWHTTSCGVYSSGILFCLNFCDIGGHSTTTWTKVYPILTPLTLLKWTKLYI